jgi:hypothetical protein
MTDAGSGSLGNSNELQLEISNAQLQRNRMAVALPADLQPARKKCKPAVLEEDEYTEAVQKIIERDFFPDIARRRLQVRRTAHSHIDPAVSTVNSPCVLTVFVWFSRSSCSQQQAVATRSEYGRCSDEL